MMLGDFAVELATLIKGGLGAQAYASVDVQSDKGHAQKRNPGFLTGTASAAMVRICGNRL